jgi:hypothetical protein
MLSFFNAGISVPGNQGSSKYLHMGSCVGGLRARLVLDPVTLTLHKTHPGLAFGEIKDSKERNGCFH